MNIIRLDIAHVYQLSFCSMLYILLCFHYQCHGKESSVDMLQHILILSRAYLIVRMSKKYRVTKKEKVKTQNRGITLNGVEMENLSICRKKVSFFRMAFLAYLFTSVIFLFFFSTLFKDENLHKV